MLFSKLIKIDIDTEQQVDSQQVLPIYQNSIINNLSKNRVRQLFLDNKKNKFDIDSKQQLYKQMFKEQQLKKQFIDKNIVESDKKIKTEKIKVYKQQVERFLELLLILVYIYKGQAARATKLLGL